MRRVILLAFEAAEREADEQKRTALLTLVIVGAGPTGVELAGALGELTRHTLARDFRSFASSSAQILLLEAGDRVLPTYSESLSPKAERALRELGVTVRTGAMVTDVNSDGVRLRTEAGEETVATRTVLWAAGVEASPNVLRITRSGDQGYLTVERGMNAVSH